MQTTILTFLLMACVGSAAAQSKGGSSTPAKPGFTLTTPDFQDGGVIPDKFTYAVKNFVSPKLEWSNVPAGTVSFALIFHDPDEAMHGISKTFCIGWSSIFRATPASFRQSGA